MAFKLGKQRVLKEGEKSKKLQIICKLLLELETSRSNARLFIE